MRHTRSCLISLPNENTILLDKSRPTPKPTVIPIHNKTHIPISTPITSREGSIQDSKNSMNPTDPTTSTPSGKIPISTTIKGNMVDGLQGINGCMSNIASSKKSS